MSVAEVQLVTVPEAAAKLKISRAFLYGLPVTTPGIYKIGRNTRIDLQEFIAGLRRLDAQDSPMMTR
jgi:hypothetical protein